MTSETHLTLHNSMTREKETFTPLDSSRVGMYVCGPTVYDRPHLGNARCMAAYDVLYRVLRAIYGAQHVQYVRNITDVDDKINKAARENGEPIDALTRRITAMFHEDMAALNLLPPTHEPRATEHISQIISLVQKMLERGGAYEAGGHVLCDVTALGELDDGYTYGALSGKKQEDLIAGSRVKVEGYKRNPSDFVLWKPAAEGDDASSIFQSPWGDGRPGWHIECSAMSTHYLGGSFDIHGGGADLKFPHHENEIIQSRLADPCCSYARYWVHNGFVTVEGEKMSKSLGNFTTVRDVLGRGVPGEVVRYMFLSTHYRKPLDFSHMAMEAASKALSKLRARADMTAEYDENAAMESAAFAALCDDLNTPAALAALHGERDAQRLYIYGRFLGLFEQEEKAQQDIPANEIAEIENLIKERTAAKQEKNWARADEIRDELSARGVTLKDGKDGTSWTASPSS